MYKLKSLVKKELREFGCKKELCVSDLEPLYYLSKIYCELEKAEDKDYDNDDDNWNDSNYQRHMNYTKKGYNAHMNEGWKETHEPHELNEKEIKEWLYGMENEDGTVGAKWSVEDTTPIAKQHGVMLGEDVSAEEWNLAMNMLYSDYCKTAKKYGVDTPDYYADLAKDFLMDKDSVEAKEKLAAYYENIVKPA